ncbi:MULTISPECIES: aminotransferase [Chelativorans]|jgi:adenosylmethionine-8-amino-7-oxononanoate aminotransferase|uniref:Aminotransferase n=1 Tax=Chelativorans sp. (strain BNC1) TaxID=266779 RepID=Q11MY4_CHESB|nr:MULTISPECIES: aminotransferase [Chelativorans]
MLYHRAKNSWEQRDQENVFHGFTDLETLNQNGPVVLTHGEGIHVFDVHGKSYMDANSGLWNNVAGFNHKGLIEAICDQARRFPGYHAFFGRIADTTVALSEKLIEISPFPSGRVYYTNSGSEANDTVVKMLWLLHRRNGQPQRRKIITRVNAYHGVTVATASMTGKTYNAEFGLPLPGFLHADCPHHWRYGEPGESEAAFSQRLARKLEELIIKEGPDTIAGMFAEPVQGAGGVIPPSRGYFEAIRPILRKYGIPLIADEVITGFGRTGEMWGGDKYNVEPDAIVASKCITAGYFPMGAIILGPELADALTRACEAAEEFPHGFTSGGNPLGSAIALKALEVIETEGLLDNVRRVSPRFLAGLDRLARHDHAGEARGVGLMGAVELVADKNSKAPLDGALRIPERIANKALEKGLICRPLGQAIVLGPPFIITEGQIGEIFDILEDTMAEVFADVGL